jgi:hypothetical protein
MPTNMKAGLAYTLDGEYNKLTISYDVNKVLVSAYPNRDIDGDERVGGYDENGHKVSGGEYNKDGQREYAHSDEWYTGIFTSWIDDWLLIYDSENDGIGKDVGGGLNQYGEKADTDGNTNDGSLGAEFKKLTHNFGIEYWYSDLFAIRVGGIYDKTGNITMKNGKCRFRPSAPDCAGPEWDLTSVIPPANRTPAPEYDAVLDEYQILVRENQDHPRFRLFYLINQIKCR